MRRKTVKRVLVYEYDLSTALGLLPCAAQVEAMRMVTLEERMLGPRCDCIVIIHGRKHRVGVATAYTVTLLIYGSGQKYRLYAKLLGVRLLQRRKVVPYIGASLDLRRFEVDAHLIGRCSGS